MSDGVVTSWRGLLAKHAAISCALERELHERHDLGVSDFEVLDHLVESTCQSPEGKYRVQELADCVHLSQSALSRLIARLEKSGLVRRSMCVDDRRGIFVQLTEEGRLRHAAAVPTHRAILAEHL